MNLKDIIRMAREAGFVDLLDDHSPSGYDIRYERFAALVAADKVAEYQAILEWEQRSYKREIQIEVEAEREECAQIADAEASIEGIAQRIAATIRARNNT